MSAWSGPAYRGAMRHWRDAKRAAAETRNKATPEAKRRRTRRRQRRGKEPAVNGSSSYSNGNSFGNKNLCAMFARPTRFGTR